MTQNDKMTSERARAEEEVRMRELARQFKDAVEEMGSFGISIDDLKELAEKFGSTKYTVKKCHPYFWFGNKVYVKC